MEKYGYGEDAFTLGALKNNLKEIMDNGHIDNIIFYRPSFGRRQFGEFDFIILSEKIILGESKWDKTKKQKKYTLTIKSEQVERHIFFADFLNFIYSQKDLNSFQKALCSFINEKGIKIENYDKSLLTMNLEFFAEKIRHKYETKPSIRNLILFFSKYDDINDEDLYLHVKGKGKLGFEKLILRYDEDPFLLLDFL